MGVIMNMSCEVWSVRKNGKLIDFPSNLDTPKNKTRKARKIKIDAVVSDLNPNDLVYMNNDEDSETWVVLQYVGTYTKPNGKEFYLMIAWFKSDTREQIGDDDNEVADSLMSANAIVDRWKPTFRDGVFYMTEFENDKGANVKAAKAIWPWKQQTYIPKTVGEVIPPPNGPMIIGLIIA